ncbi:hypothetical protein V865_007236 [Kwoniella europaea PYCC6329]|uniref:Thioester reductase (TE) domain-containing protein n=1 Tax=Kwoniella europaea PYCC6329 TaxID=1423913 RepID=A0AAX4KT80_9TREE
MECLKQCWSGRSRSNKPRTAKYNLQSLIEQGSDPERTNESVTGPYSATTAVLYRGDGPLDGTDTKWTLGLLPKDQMSAEAERYSWTIRAFEEDIKNLEGVEEGLKGPITTSSKLIRTLDPHVHKRFPRGCCMGFSRGAGDVYTEIGSPSHGLVEIMPWVTIMTKTDDIAALTTENRFPFHADQYNRILTGYEYAVPYSRRKCNSTSEADPVQESSILESLLQADEADPRNAQPPMLKVTLAGYQTSDDTREHDTYDFRFSLADDVTEGNQKTQPSADTDSITFNSFETKRQIEEHLKARSSQSQMVFTIIRPSAFFGNFYWPPYKLDYPWGPSGIPINGSSILPRLISVERQLKYSSLDLKRRDSETELSI